MTRAYLVFHLNLAFSSIEAAQREVVIARCYDPLLDLIARRRVPIGIELTGWTLWQIAGIRPDWVERFRGLLADGQCELIGSGYVQLIGPLVPARVNTWNQRLGLTDYQALLGIQPNLALVNEMAYSSGIVSAYLDAGYRGLIMDRDNVRLALNLQHQAYEVIPSHARSPGGAELPVLWSDSILFQKLQRWAHGDIAWDDYLQYFRKRAQSATRPLAVYCNDAEIFDFRPGRFLEESALAAESEWRRIDELLHRLQRQEKVEWLSPSAALAASLVDNPHTASSLTSISQPIPVKKQAKYNIARWAVSGRNDLWLNTLCHRRLAQLGAEASERDQRELCELWASDFRTHITAARWQRLADALRDTEHVPPSPVWRQPTSDISFPEVTESEDGLFISIRSHDIQMVLNRRRGLTVHRLAFRSQNFEPLVGTLSHGYFDAINYGADFYSGGTVIELPGEHRRITDLLVPVSVRMEQEAGGLRLVANIDTPLGRLEKTISLEMQGERVSLGYAFPGWTRPRGIVRLATITLLPEAFEGPLVVSCVNGGAEEETFMVDRECDHSQASSSLVSCTTGFGATDGRFRVGDGCKGVLLSWHPGQCAAFPMLVHHPVSPSHLTRIVFSLSELDDTSRPEGVLPGFVLEVAPA